MMKKNIAEECAKLSAEEKITFSEVVQKLNEAGIEGYIANLLSSTKTFFLGAETYNLPISIHHPSNIPPTLDKPRVVQAIRKIQSGEIKYQQFLTDIMQAGSAFYIVFIQGKKVVYYGRHGDCHIEHFPR